MRSQKICRLIISGKVGVFHDSPVDGLGDMYQNLRGEGRFDPPPGMNRVNRKRTPNVMGCEYEKFEISDKTLRVTEPLGATVPRDEAGLPTSGCTHAKLQ